MRGLAARATNVNEIRLSDLVLSGSPTYFKYMLGTVVGTLVGEKSEQGGKRRRKSESEKVCSLFMPYPSFYPFNAAFTHTFPFLKAPRWFWNNLDDM